LPLQLLVTLKGQCDLSNGCNHRTVMDQIFLGGLGSS
jgi:hypothetical protein